MGIKQRAKDTRRDMMEAVVGSVKAILVSAKAAEDKMLEVISIVDEADQENVTDEQLKKMETKISEVVDSLVDVYSEAITGAIATSIVNFANDVMDDSRAR